MQEFNYRIEQWHILRGVWGHQNPGVLHFKKDLAGEIRKPGIGWFPNKKLTLCGLLQKGKVFFRLISQQASFVSFFT